MIHKIKISFLLLLLIASSCQVQKLEKAQITTSNVGEGWANNSINTVIFRRNSLDSDGKLQFIAYYDPEGFVVLGKRELSSDTWELNKTAYKGNVNDAHNSISIALDGEGYLHISWDHHDNELRYAKSKDPLSLELGEKESMTGLGESKVTYPEFHRLPDGNLIFMYRSGSSGRGNLLINKYDLKSKSWQQIHTNLIDGEDKRSAYWQSYVDQLGNIHLSWVWRESWDVSTNHDMAYAVSKDQGLTWEKSSGEKYKLPITESSAEYAWKIPQKSSLINQTGMTADNNGNPYIVTYWADEEIPQLQVIYLKDGSWKKASPNHRTQPFYLGGGGTKRIPISRPQVLVDDQQKIYIIYRDEERDNKVTLVYQNKSKWDIRDLTNDPVGQWEPTYDISLWKKMQSLHLFVQNVEQIDGEGIAEGKSSTVRIIELNHNQ
ncbi:BNR repeat-containing protein [Belliella sp. DSM 107340]|uniref:BNR repeat-containing protein n=1 Tax=Belliella calami TaxID=2923436 RepID=A0ABS9UMH2_9BACT|nr:BNR repeat-containing protein [Belliella calami]MCH7397803.1 BNR repeat-containing protein [Belliella calami]